MPVVISEEDTLLDAAFIKEMVKQTRALDSHGIYDKKSPADLLAPFIITKEQRRQIPIIGDPNQAILSRINIFYNAIAILIEKGCGLMAVPLINLNHEGFGRVVITVGKLVVVDRTLRDVHRFGFISLEKMITEADKLIATACTLVEQYRDVADL